VESVVVLKRLVVKILNVLTAEPLLPVRELNVILALSLHKLIVGGLVAFRVVMVTANVLLVMVISNKIIVKLMTVVGG